MIDRIQLLREWMHTSGFEAVLLRFTANFAWLTHGRQNHILLNSPQGVADLIVFPDRLVCVTSEMEQQRIALEELINIETEFVTIKWTEDSTLPLQKLLAGKKVASDMPFPGAQVISEVLLHMRSQLDSEQIEQYREVGKITIEAIESVAKKLTPGMTEHEISSYLHQAVTARGAQAVVVLVSVDERIHQFRHPIPTGKALKQHVMLVVCAQKYGLVGNATRFVFFGQPPTELLDNVYKCAYIDARMQAKTKPGVLLSEVFNEAILVYEQMNFPDEWRYLHLGGLTGYASREVFATPDRHQAILLNQAYAWNPALPGAKSEDTLLVAKEGLEILTRLADWPVIHIEWNGHTYERPDLLILD